MVVLKNNVTLYMHTCKQENKSYIGITSRNPSQRWQNGLGYCTNPEFYADIMKYGWENIEHIILEENLTVTEAERKEAEYIAKYDTIRNGYNRSAGGSGFAGCRHTEASKQKISKKVSGENNANYGGAKCTDAWRARQSAAQKGKRLTEETKIKIGNAVRGKISHTEEFKRALSERARRQVMRDDGTVYPSCTSAAKANGVSQSAISHSIRRNQKSAGHYWSYTEK